jgi:hypothetical protein
MNEDYLRYLTGHQSFHIRNNWFPKAFDAIENDVDIFSKKGLVDAIDWLGIGSNMVMSLRYWLRAFNLTIRKSNSYILTENAKELVKFDKTIQSSFSKWLLHIWFSHNSAIWQMYYIEDRVVTFSKDQLIDRLVIKLKEKNHSIERKTIKELTNVFIRVYFGSEKVDPEENMHSPLADLKILEKISKNEFRFRVIQDKDIPIEIVHYLLVTKQKKNLIDLEEAHELIKRYIKIDYLSLRKIIDLLEKKDYLQFDRAVGLNNIILPKNKIYKLEDYKGLS